MPFPDLLWWSRLPMALLAVVSLVVGFVLLVRAAGRPAGYLFALLGAVNPYLLDVLRRAMSEAPLLAGTMLAALAGLLGLDGWQRRAAQDRPKGWAFLPPLLWLGLSGLCCGLAGAAKLNGLAGAAAGVALAIAGPLFHQGRRPVGARLAFAVIAPLVVLGSAIGVFVGSNPFLYPDPAGRTLRMAQFRLDEMAVQQQMFDFQRIDGIGERLTIVPQRVLEEYAAIRFGGSEYLNIALGLVGLAALAATAWRWIRRDNPDGAGLTLLLFAAAMVPPALLTPLDWDRYYLLPVFFSTAFIAAGIAWALRWLVRGWLRRQEAGR